jgi:hypothetical protein
MTRPGPRRAGAVEQAQRRVGPDRASQKHAQRQNGNRQPTPAPHGPQPPPAHARYPVSSSAITCWTALIRARWVNACGKFPR